MASLIHTLVVVSGANQGIGKEIVRGFMQRLSSSTDRVILCSRNAVSGQEAVDELQKEEGLATKCAVETHQLDITDDTSVAKLATYVKDIIVPQTIFVLVNNAGFAFKRSSTEPFDVQARVSMDINFFGTLRMMNAFFDLLYNTPDKVIQGRMINIGSRAGLPSIITNEPLRHAVMLPKDIDGLVELANQFVSKAKDDTHAASGWPVTAYGTSKIFLLSSTSLVASKIPPAMVSAGSFAVTVCPGFCKTNMSSYSPAAPLTAAQGADTPLWLGLLSTDEATLIENGGFYAERKALHVSK